MGPALKSVGKITQKRNENKKNDSLRNGASKD